jgi:hypothetical protein
MTAPSPRYRRTKVFTDWDKTGCLSRVGWRLVDENSHWSKKPTNVLNVPFPFPAKIIERIENGKIMFFGPDGGQDNPNNGFPCTTSEIWTSGTCRNYSHMNFMSASRVFLFWTSAPKWLFKKLILGFSVVPNDRLVVEPFYETMELCPVSFL